MLDLIVTWRSTWYPFSRYERGEITGERFGVNRIYRHKKTGQVRIYSDLNMDGRKIAVNGGPAVTMRPRGRFGKLYLGFRED